MKIYFTVCIVKCTQKYISFCYATGGFTSRSSKEPVVLPTAPRAARGPRVADEDIPINPPYVAYLSNLPYEVDESYLIEFFGDMKVYILKYIMYRSPCLYFVLTRIFTALRFRIYVCQKNPINLRDTDMSSSKTDKV